jgi:hypothetical protein
MTPKEKAKDLKDKFQKQIFFHVTDERLDINEAKGLALIAVENEYYSLREMLIHFQGTKVINDVNFYLKFLQKLIDEEQEVKQEIEKL